MIAAIFPGQGSQKVGMGRALVEKFPKAAAVFEELGETLGIDLRKLCWESDEDTLRQTQNAQIALYACGVAAYSVWTEQGQTVQASAGHSIGEYAALTAAGVLSLTEGARLVRTRGELMAAAGKTEPGTMAAVLGLERDALQKICAETSGRVVVANDNCPGQLVISGEIDAVRLAGETATAAGAKRVLPLNVSGAFHSPLMEKPAAEMSKALEAAHFAPTQLKVFSNVTAGEIDDESLWAGLLTEQLRSSVRWTESVQAMIAAGVDTFIEFGSGEVLCGLIKRIDKEVRGFAVNDRESLAKAEEAMKQESLSL